MAISRRTAIWAVVILGVLCVTVSAKSKKKSPVAAPAPGPSTAVGSDCMTLIYNMSDCLTYVEKGSNSTKPDKGCCPELAGMLDNQPICLCKLLAKSNDFPVQLDLNRALRLPTVCGLKTPPLSACSTVGVPFGAPIGSPTSSEGASSSSALAPTSGKNGGSKAKGNAAYLVAGLALAYASSLLTL